MRCKTNRKIKNYLEKKLKGLEKGFSDYDNLQQHNKNKSKLEEKKFVKDKNVRSKCTFYKEVDKSTNSFQIERKRQLFKSKLENSLLTTKKLPIKIKYKMSFDFFTKIF